MPEEAPSSPCQLCVIALAELGAGQALLPLPWQLEPWHHLGARCHTTDTGHRQFLSPGLDKEVGTKNLLGIVLCHGHLETVGPEFPNPGNAGMETGDQERTGEGSGGIFPGGADLQSRCSQTLQTGELKTQSGITALMRGYSKEITVIRAVGRDVCSVSASHCPSQFHVLYLLSKPSVLGKFQ